MRSNEGIPLNESNWTTEEECQKSAYTASKTYAEKCAWKHQEESKGKLELVTINPSMMFGETETFTNTSIAVPYFAMKGELITANATGTWTDVKDAALAHYRALVRHEAANKRFIIDSGNTKLFS